MKLLLQTKVREMQKKIESRKMQIEVCSSVINEKQLEIECLKKQLESVAEPNTHVKLLQVDKPVEVESIPIETIVFPSVNTNANQNETLCFSEFAGQLAEQQLAELRIIGPTKRDDSKFVSLALRSLYEGRLDVLKIKSITGRTKPGAQKEKFSPQNIKAVQSLFYERVESLAIAPQERAEKKNVNKYIKDAQNNISRILKSQEEEKEIARKLNF